MGLYDRDYYRERFKEQPKKNQRCFRDKKSFRLKHILYSLTILGLLWYGIRNHLYSNIPLLINTPKPIPGGVILPRDDRGHYRGIAYINGVPMQFMIDTGASRIAIPKIKAIQAGLSKGKPIISHTAGGTVLDYQTRLKEIRIGNAVLYNIPAIINDHIDEVLVGMNFVKNFTMIQNGDTLTLKYPGYNGEIPISTVTTSPKAQRSLRRTIDSPATATGRKINDNRAALAISQKYSQSKHPSVRVIKKSICSVHEGIKRCITAYSDH
ncbi:aspartyl protease family protein [Methylomarinovum tepidoasis]|uniref:Aspartyl protease family protein n=1 Tax=Methylomarinovum tepidoasis TaxID=2840183 RepID=A0AAU9BYH9_9GAMM|nr:retropepsin-like aspartic protease [Methylomarinovum sp. IN45]BCX88588.1 aspartyl protease family protein [Methylomarinovum sp. IN45]